MKVDRQMLGLCIEKAHKKHGYEWEDVAEDVITEFFKKGEMAVSDTSLAIAIVISAFDDKKVPAIKSVEDAVGWIGKQVERMNGQNMSIPKLEPGGKIGMMVYPPEIYAKAMWIERLLTMYEEGKEG